MKFVKQHVSKAVLAIVMLGGFVLPAAAQDLKIGVVSLPALIERAPQTKAAMDALQEEFAPRQREFEAKKKEYDDLAARSAADSIAARVSPGAPGDLQLGILQGRLEQLRQAQKEAGS